MPFYYQEKFIEHNLSDCPPKNYRAKDITEVFRWVFDEMEDDRNFKSQFDKKPQRYLTKDDAAKCSGLALSMFDSLENAIVRFTFLKKMMKTKVYQELGTKVSVGQITQNDGVCGELNKDGHFNHHPMKNHNYSQRFKIIHTL
ncbi:MAG: hypothetical protein JNL70_12400 [Saprospiraceae bacterium]|nr:hypothetical protein [Saprospiraceae bacterium]